jgi:putative phosphoesterase
MKVAVFADIHANIFALEAALLNCEAEGVEHFIVAGDLVGYYYWPQLVVRRLMSDGRFTCIRGNHEDIFEETLVCSRAAEKSRKKYGTGYDVCRDYLSKDELDWLLHLPANTEIDIEGVHFAVYHGSPAAADEYVYPDAAADVLKRCFVSRDITVLGHTHYPMLHESNGRILINPGSIGQPRDYGGHASYALVDLDNYEIDFKRISYDVSPLISEAMTRDPSLKYLHEILSRRVL